MNRGLASLPVKRFQSGGILSNSPIGGLFAPIVSVDTPFGPISATPATALGLAVPAASVPLALLGIANSLTATQAPAPVSSVEGQIASTVAAEATDAVDAAEGLAAMTAANAQAQAADDAATTSAAQTASMAEAVADSIAAANAADAAAAAAAASAAAGVGADGAGGAAPGADGASGVGADGSAASSSGGGEGERAGGLIGRKHYQFGGSVMGMGDSSPQYSYAPLMMAEGGLAAAHKAQSMGRGDDTMLVHMTPGEVRGLQALAMAQGGSLSINPSTGLPEASILRSLLPAIAGAALNFFAPGIGTAIGGALGLGGAAGTGIAVGGLTALATGSLKKGLMAGMGAYGGAGLSEGLITSATPSTPPTTIPEGSPLVTSTPTNTDAINAAIQPRPMPVPGATSTYDPNAMFGNVGSVPQTQLGMGTLGGTGPTSAQVLSPGPLPTSSMLRAPITPPPVSTPIAPTPIVPDTAVSTALTPSPVMSGKDLFKYGSAALSPVLAEPPPALKVPKTYIRPYDVAVDNVSGTPPYAMGSTYERPQVRYTYTPRPIYEAAEGGAVDPDYNMNVNRVGAFSDNYAAGGETGLAALAKKRRSLMGDKPYKFAEDRRDKSMEAAIEQNFARGGVLPPRFLSGGGDGMSDSIKANIDGKQEARLADGEFVVPADVVSHLGNGSSKAGAKKLYAMMDKIRKARTGRKRQAPEVNAARYMPA